MISDRRLTVFSPQMGFMLNLGGGRYDYEQLSGLASLGHEIRVVAPLRNRTASEVPPQVRCRWFRGHGIRGIRLSWTLPFIVPSTLECWQKRPDIVRVHNPYYVGLLGLLIGKFFRVPVIAIILHFEDCNGFTRWVDHVLLPRFDGLLFISTATQQRFVELHPNYKGITQVSYPGIPEPMAPADNVQQQTLKVSAPFFLFVGSLTPRKNLEWLLRTFARYRISGGQAELVIAGEGAERNKLETVALSLDLATVVHFLGRISEEDKSSLYQDAVALLFPSQMEGFGFCVVEAMKLGTPCIVSDRGSLPEVVTNNSTGYVIPLEEQARWASSMELLSIDKRTRDALGRAAKADVEERFSWEKSNKEAASFFKRVIEALS